METKSSLLNLFERLEGFVGKLPGSLQKPILQEIVPLKDLFLRQRAPRFVLDRRSGGRFGGVVQRRLFRAGGSFRAGVDRRRGAARVRVAGFFPSRPRRPAFAGCAHRRARRAAVSRRHPGRADDRVPPTCFCFCSASGTDESRARVGPRRARTPARSVRAHPPGPSRRVGHRRQFLRKRAAPRQEMDAARTRLQIALASRPNIARHMAPALDVATFMRFRLDGTFDPESDRRYHVAELVHALVAELPNEARLEMARLSGAREAQAKIAQTLIKSTAAVCGALGAQPIPLADLPFLLTFQLAMVSGIIYISGREMSLKLGTEFLGTMGINFGLGLALREGARAAIRAASKLLLPGVGNAISGFVAASGTYAVGRAALAYYIEGASLADARRLFQRSQRPDQGVFHLPSEPPGNR